MHIHHGHILGLAAFIIPGTAVFLPLSVAPISYIFAAIFLLMSGRRLLAVSAALKPLQVCTLLLGWIAISLIWTVDQSMALEKFPRLVLGVFLGTLPIAAAALLSDMEKSRFIKLLVPGYGWCLLLLVLGLMREYGDLLPFVAPHNGIPGKEDFRMNRGATILVLFLWPVLMLTWRRPLLSLFLCAAVLFPSVYSRCDAAIAGLAVSGMVFAVARVWPRATLNMAMACCILYILAAPFLHAKLTDPKHWGVTGKLMEAEQTWMPRSAYHRLLIWDFTAEKALERPITGWGFYSSRVIPGGKEKLDSHEDALPLHPHNGVLQIWAELGGVGALLLVLLCLSIRRAMTRIRSLPECAIGISMFMCAFVIICVSYGIWQSWWIAALLLVSAFFVGAKQEAPQSAGARDG